MKQQHNFPPLYDENSRILILGSFPSVKSREAAFFYGHPQNRFWALIAFLLNEKCPETIEEKKNLLHYHHIALWDVIAECEIKGSADSSICDVKVNDLTPILQNCPIKQIFVNGRTAEKLYNKYIFPVCGKKAIALPSTSPANAAWNMEKLQNEWKIILDFLS